ncbi:ABC transporter permease [Marisediminicola senii]|uniref:ABC transporter permease n=1 Tax=Marisediminicola senii TaxID=2711233 RepID=UPI0013EDBDDE|nr:ABC transporter permease [Marisediminicola senii]
MARPVPTSPSGARPIAATRAVRLVAGREITTRLRSRSFLVSSAILMLTVLASIIIGGVLTATADLPKVAVQRSVVNALPTVMSYETVLVQTVAEAEQLLRDGEVEAAVLSGSTESDLGFTVVGLDQAPTAVIASLSTQPDVRILDPGSQDPFLVYLVALGFGLVFFASSITFGTTIAQSVVEEKQTRIVEILLATISARLLLAGKVIGNSLLAFGQIILITTVASIGLLVTGQQSLLGQVGPAVGWFVLFFVFGFVLLAALFAASGSLVSRVEDVGTVISPVMTLVMIPYLGVILFNDNALVLAVMSYVPFSAPVGMPMRLFLGTAEWWEPLLSLAILILTTAGAIALGARIYSNALLRTGSRVRLRDAIAG